ncbi:MAG: tRNA (cytidine(34)-2'-O)-methyltransferase [Silvanigrellaceae bacterium]
MTTPRSMKKIRRRGRNTARGWLAQSVKTYLRALESTESQKPRSELFATINELVGQVLAGCEKSPRSSAPVSAILNETVEWLVDELGIDETASRKALEKRKSAATADAAQKFESSFKGLTPLSQLTPNPPVSSCPVLKRDEHGELNAESVAQLRDYHPEIVLISPQIPPNTGTIARLCAAFSCRLHLIEPIAFDVSEKSFRRAGLDYWQFVELYVHQDWDHFLALRPNRRIVLVETGGQKSPSQFEFEPGDLLVFGAETFGIPQNILAQCKESQRGQLVTIPMFDRGVRSLNLANSVSIVAHCALARLHEGSP